MTTAHPIYFVMHHSCYTNTTCRQQSIVIGKIQRILRQKKCGSLLLSVNATKAWHHQCGRDVTIITPCSRFFHSQHVWMQQSYFTSLHDSLILLTTDTYKMPKEFVFKDRSSSAVLPNCCKTINFILRVFTNPEYTIQMIYKTQRTHTYSTQIFRENLQDKCM